MPLAGTPTLNLVYKEEGLQVFFMDAGDGSLSIHAHIEGDIPISRMKHLEEVWLLIVLGLHERGMKTIEAWVEYGDATKKRFAQFFGFEETGFLKEVTFYKEDGTEYFFLMEEMQYVIPIED